MKTSLCLLLLFLFSVICVPFVFSQGAGFKIPFIVNDNGSSVDTMYFGLNTLATYCIDANLGEYELPPKPPSGIFDARFTDPRGNSECLGQGTRINLHSKFSPIDTFQVEFQAGDGGFPINLAWPSNLDSFSYFDIHLVDLFNGAFVNVDMLTNNTTTITNSAFSTLRIIAISFIDLAVRENNLIPKKFDLDQNYPNPFNPTTSIKYAVEKKSVIDISVFDLIGRKIATVVREGLTPGYYSSMWNGRNGEGIQVGSGVYYLKMTVFEDGSSVTGQGQLIGTRKIMMAK